MAVLAFVTLQPASATEQECPKGDLPVSATIEGHMLTVGFNVGARWGEGILTLNDGTEDKFTAEGAKLLETGAAKVTLKGNVYNLQKREDFEGDYGAVEPDEVKVVLANFHAYRRHLIYRLAGHGSCFFCYLHPKS